MIPSKIDCKPRYIGVYQASKENHEIYKFWGGFFFIRQRGSILDKAEGDSL